MIFLFIVNVIVLTLVAREFCQKVTEETPGEGREEEEKKTSELPAVELTTEEELVTKTFGQEETQEHRSQTTGTALVTEEEEEPQMDSEQQSRPFYELKAALTSMWLPAVVGDKKNFFIAASLSTLIMKILILLVSVILAYFFQENIHPHPFIFWSRVGKMFNCLLIGRSI